MGINVRRKAAYKKLLLCAALLGSIVLIIVYLQQEDIVFIVDRSYTRGKINDAIRKYGNTAACKQPDLPVTDPDMMKFVKYVPPIDCSGAESDWVTCVKSECHIKDKIKQQKPSVECSFNDIIRLDDNRNEDGKTVATSTSYKLEKSDAVKVQCHSSNGETWKSVLTGLRHDEGILDRSTWSKVPDEGFKMNVLMFGFDSLSRNTVIRKLPKSYQYLTETLGAHILKGYNIVGDGTPQALTPMLTGKNELELPDARKRIPTATFVDSYPFIWNDFRESGYVTGYLEDCASTGTYSYRLRGFNKPPTDHFMRPYYLTTAKLFSKWLPYCAGSTPRHLVMFNHAYQFFDMYKDKPKFLFGFHGELSHDSYNMVGAADDDLLIFLQMLKSNGSLNNTLFIFMADHGHRFADIRNTLQGKHEERLPFFSFIFPDWFKSKHQQAYQNFVGNLDRLVTPYDIHATLMDVLRTKNLGNAVLSERSLSLFSKIPAERSCTDAYIESHWCACLEWKPVPLDASVVTQLTDTLLNTINAYTESERNRCAKLELGEVYWVNKLRPNENLLKFKKNADADGFIPDLSGKMMHVEDTYQLKVRTRPGDGLFESSITYDSKTDSFELKLNAVSRINMYGSQARCVDNTLHNLRKYCYCTID